MKKRFISSILPIAGIIVIILFISAKDRYKDRSFKRTQLLMGTIVEITVLEDEKVEAVEEAVEAALTEMKRLEHLLGRHQEGSDIWRVNMKVGEFVPVSDETTALVKDSLKFSHLSGGAFDITLGRLSELWNFEEERDAPPPDAEIRKSMEGVGAGSVHLDETKKTVKAANGVHLDLGGIAKGYIIDSAAALLVSKGVNNFIVNAGGDMVIKGKKGSQNWRVGIQHPRDQEKVLAHLDVEDDETAIVTSGDYERYFIYEGKRYHHILDPFTGYPARGVISVTIKSRDAKTADALSTAVFVLGPEKGMKLIESLEGTEGMLVTEDEKILLSSGLKGKVVIR